MTHSVSDHKTWSGLRLEVAVSWGTMSYYLLSFSSLSLSLAALHHAYSKLIATLPFHYMNKSHLVNVLHPVSSLLFSMAAARHQVYHPWDRLVLHLFLHFTNSSPGPALAESCKSSRLILPLNLLYEPPMPLLFVLYCYIISAFLLHIKLLCYTS